MTDRMAVLLEKCKPRMAEIAQQFDKDDAVVVALYEEAKDIARSNNMLSSEKIHSKYMYVDTMNRYEDGVVPSDVTDLMSKIYNNGFRNEHLLMPTCAECPLPILLLRLTQSSGSAIRWRRIRQGSCLPIRATGSA